MSAISNRHNVVPFIAGKSVPFNGQRLLRVLYKPSGKGKERTQKLPSVCVSVPSLNNLEISEEILEKLSPYILTMIEDTQDKIVKSLYESSRGKLSNIADEDIDINAVIGYLENEISGGRLTKEFLTAWFNENVQDNLCVAIAEKMGLVDPSPTDWERINKSVNGYREMISALSGGAVIYSIGQCSSLLKALEIAGTDDDVNKKLVGRLNRMMNPQKVEELIEL
jgi:hypothetical protein